MAQDVSDQTEDGPVKAAVASGSVTFVHQKTQTRAFVIPTPQVAGAAEPAMSDDKTPESDQRLGKHDAVCLPSPPVAVDDASCLEIDL